MDHIPHPQSQSIPPGWLAAWLAGWVRILPMDLPTYVPTCQLSSGDLLHSNAHSALNYNLVVASQSVIVDYMGMFKRIIINYYCSCIIPCLHFQFPCTTAAAASDFIFRKANQHTSRWSPWMSTKRGTQMDHDLQSPAQDQPEIAPNDVCLCHTG